MKAFIVVVLFLACVSQSATLVADDPQEMPKVKKRVDPLYPQIFKLAGVEGEVEIRVRINEQGIVETEDVVKATNQNFVPAALDAIKQWEFYPATKDGKPIKAELVIPFVFRKGTGSYRARFDDVMAVRDVITDILKGDISDSLKSYVDIGAYAVIGNRYEHLYSMIFDQPKSSLLTEGHDSKANFSHTLIDDSGDSAFFVLKTNPGKGKADRYHTVVLMKSPDGQWKIRGWHTANQ
ncbi:MAG: energy transducer TonB [Bacteroidota bacterium]|jgi:TonB family protein